MGHEAARDGIKHIVCTPHSNSTYHYNADVIEERLRELRERLDGVVELSLGCDFHMSADNISAAIANPFSYSINRKGYLLIEFPTMWLSRQVREVTFQLQLAGYKLIITHPERCPAVQNDPEVLADWMRRGCLVQVTASSLYGERGRTVESLANELLERNWINFLATDAHRMDWRPPHMKEAYDYVARRVGEETARRLCVTNPQAAVEGAEWPEQPEPVGLQDHAPLKFNAKRSATPQRGFWSRFWGRR
jgi:protein-tyrosine phosphatase